MDEVELRELRYFAAVAEELHFGRAAVRLRMSQPPLSRAIQRLERRLGVVLFDRDRRGVRLTAAGAALREEVPRAFDAVAAAVERTRRAGDDQDRLVLVTKAGASHALLSELLDGYAARTGAPQVQVLMCEVGEQRSVLHQGRADVALVHSPYDVLDGFDTQALLTEGQVAILPAGHPLARRTALEMADVVDVPGLPMARWPRHDGSYPPGAGPEARRQSELAQLVALGRTLLVIPASSRAWQWPDHVAVPVLDAPLVTTMLAWSPSTRTARLTDFLETARRVAQHRSRHEGVPHGRSA